MRIAEALLLTALMAPGTLRAAVQDDVRGDWMTEDRRGIVRFGPCGGVICGVIVGTSDWPTNGDVLRDNQGRPQCHLAIINGLRPAEDRKLHGTVTDPEDGRTYDAIVWVPADGVLRLRGYIALPVLGSTQLWPRFRGKVQPDCHFPRG